MDTNHLRADAETAYAATGDHHLSCSLSMPSLLPLSKVDSVTRWNSSAFVIINTHVDDGGAILTWRSKYDETLRALSDRYLETLDSSAMDRYHWEINYRKLSDPIKLSGSGLRFNSYKFIGIYRIENCYLAAFGS